MKTNWMTALVLASLSAAGFGQQSVTPAAAVMAPPESAEVLRLDDVLRLALERNPEVAGSQSTIRATQHRVSESRALPDSTVSAGWAGKQALFDTMAGNPSSYRGLTVSEQFPYPGKLELQGKMAARVWLSARRFQDSSPTARHFRRHRLRRHRALHGLRSFLCLGQCRHL